MEKREIRQSEFTFGARSVRSMATEPGKDSYFLALFNKKKSTEETFTKVLDIIISNGQKCGLKLNKDSFIFEKFDFELPFDYVLFSIDRAAQGAILSSIEVINQHVGYIKKFTASLKAMRRFLDKYTPWTLFLVANQGNRRLKSKWVRKWFRSAQTLFGSNQKLLSSPFIYSREFTGVSYTTLIFRDKTAYNGLKKVKKVFIKDMEVNILDWDSLSQGACLLRQVRTQIEKGLDPADGTSEIFSLIFY